MKFNTKSIGVALMCFITSCTAINHSPMVGEWDIEIDTYTETWEGELAVSEAGAGTISIVTGSLEFEALDFDGSYLRFISVTQDGLDIEFVGSAKGDTIEGQLLGLFGEFDFSGIRKMAED